MPMRSSPATRRGLALICLLAAMSIAGWNWHGQHRRVPTEVSSSLPAPAQSLSSPAQVRASELADPPVDPVFGQQAATPLLRRVVEMYQPDPATPKTHAGVWADHLLNADASASRNFPIASADFFAGVAQWHGQWLSHEAIRALQGVHRLTPEASLVPQNMLASFSVEGDYLVSSSDPAQPRPGDLRISWTAVTWPPAEGAADAVIPPAAGAIEPAPVLASWRPVAAYLLAAVLLLIAAGLLLGPRRRH
ncbi:hypothetical protein Fraau_0269 [Frateuria aurantia DSM 6220]|uniref:Uncharacterized protein n=2 Tax=Frateuria aurantia TaxID=81475 RepID=H8L2C8_FRAAD|nr:hypothetical protein Fraau_0269 [Frateuria aurantia DSM 6220]